MPYTGPNDSKLPDHVQKLPKKQRTEWAGIWNGIYNRCIEAGGEHSECEGEAYAIANAQVVVKGGGMTEKTNNTAQGTAGGYAVERDTEKAQAETVLQQITGPLYAIYQAITGDLLAEGSMTGGELEIVTEEFEAALSEFQTGIIVRLDYLADRPANTLVEPDTDGRIREDEMKIGARNSASDFRRIQDIHDLTVKLGAACDRKNTGDMYTIKDEDGNPVAKSYPVKSLGRNRIGQYGVLFGTSDEVDLAGEWFTAKTAEFEAIFERIGRVPVLYQHAMDDHLKTSVVGAIDVMARDDVGLWVEAQLDMRHEYVDAIRELIEAGKLHWSSGTLPGARKVAKSGEILRWPIVELSLTPTPAEYRMLERPIADVQAHYKAIGAVFTERDTNTSQAADAGATVDRTIEAALGRLNLLELEVIP